MSPSRLTASDAVATFHEDGSTTCHFPNGLRVALRPESRGGWVVEARQATEDAALELLAQLRRLPLLQQAVR